MENQLFYVWASYGAAVVIFTTLIWATLSRYLSVRRVLAEAGTQDSQSDGGKP